MSGEIDKRLSNLETEVALIKSLAENNQARIAKHKEELSLRLDRICLCIEELKRSFDNIMFQENTGLINRVNTNSEYIKSHIKLRNDVLSHALKAVIIILLTFISYKLGLSPG